LVTSYSQQVVRSFLWQGGAQAAGQIISWLSTILVIRFLLPADYGLMAMANVFLGFFFLFADLGFGAAAVQARTLDKDELRRMLGMVIIAHVSGFVIMFAGASLVGQFFGDPRLAPVIRALSFNFLLLAAAVLPQAHVLREMEFRVKARIEVIALVPAAAITLAMAAAGKGVWALVAGAIASQAIRTIAYNVARPTLLVPSFSRGAIAGLARFGALISLSRILFFLYGQVDVLIGGRILGTDAIGEYSIALSLAVIPLEKVLPVITQVSFAAFSRIQAEPDRVQRNVLRAVQLVSLICFPAALGMAAVAGDLIPVVVGPHWVHMIVPFQILCLTMPLMAINALYAPAILAMGRPGLNAWNTAVSLAFMTLAAFGGVKFGVIGLCVARLIAFPCVLLITSWRTLLSLKIPYLEFANKCAFPAAASVVMAAAVVSFRSVLGPFGVSAWRLGALIAMGALLYGGLVLLFQRVVVRDLIGLVRG
jgi:teichuronic acid exporter